VVGKEATTVVAAGTEIQRATQKLPAEVGRGATMAEAGGTEIQRGTQKLPVEAGKRGIVVNRAAVGTMTTTKDIAPAAVTTMTTTAAGDGADGSATRAAIPKPRGGAGKKAIAVSPVGAAMMTTMTTGVAVAAEDGSAIREAILKQHAGASLRDRPSNA
jgi:hypothetical protein